MRKHNLAAAHAARLDSRDGVRRDHRNGSMLQKFLIEEYIGGQNGVGGDRYCFRAKKVDGKWRAY